LNQKRLVGAKNPRMGVKNEVIRPLCETTNENPKCHLHIPQPRKGIYVLNIIVQGLVEKKKKSEGKGPQRNTQNPNAPIRGPKI
jgi:hypothetical protein